MTTVRPNGTPEERKAEEERIRATLHPNLQDSFVMLRPGDELSDHMEALFPKEHHIQTFRRIRQMDYQHDVTKKMEELSDATKTGS